MITARCHSSPFFLYELHHWSELTVAMEKNAISCCSSPFHHPYPPTLSLPPPVDSMETEHVQCGKGDLSCSSWRTHLPSRSGSRWASILPQTSLSFWLPLPKLSSFVPPKRPMICLLFGPQPPIHVPQESRQKRKRHRPEPFAQTDCGKATIKRCWAWMELRCDGELPNSNYSLCLWRCPPLSITTMCVEESAKKTKKKHCKYRLYKQIQKRTANTVQITQPNLESHYK